MTRWCVRGLRWLVLGVVSTPMLGCDQPPYIPPLITDYDTDTSTVCDVQPTLSSLKTEYFGGSCVFSGCHNSKSHEGELDLEKGDIHAALVNVAAADKKAGPRGKLRVVPNDPESSFLVQKVEGRMERDEGEWMPDGTDEVIDPDCRVKMLRQWITDGALDN